jgi:tetratricopeptide (TPR) repeat protein
MFKRSLTWKITAITTVVMALQSSQAFAGYAQALAFFKGGDYSSAASEFFQAYTYPKAKGEKLKAEWGLAQSLQRLGLLYSASQYYSKIVVRGPKSTNIFFRQALEELGTINNTINLGQSHIVELFRTKISPGSVPGKARGFYFYYLGTESYNDRKYEVAKGYFDRVPAGSPYHLQTMLKQGVVANLQGRHSAAIGFFERVIRGAPDNERGDYMRELANLNIARVHYETRRYNEALAYYGQIPRESDNWLQALFEASWAFFMRQDHNDTLGEIHTIQSPFFENRFYPESYVLQAITFLRLCRYDEVKNSLKKFKDRYEPVFKDVQALIQKYRGDSKGFFGIVYKYRTGDLNSYKDAWMVLDSVSRTDPYKEAADTIRFADRELAALSRFRGRWSSTGLQNELERFLSQKKSLAIRDSGKRMMQSAVDAYEYLRELSNNTKLINAEMLLGKIDELRSQINVGTGNDRKVNFIGGLQPLKVGEALEYWPFEKEYWEDELGYYKYNIDSVCRKNVKNSGKSK